MTTTTETPLAPIPEGAYTDDPIDFEYKGRKFRVTLEYDHDAGPPQNECDGHGVIVAARETPGHRLGNAPDDVESLAAEMAEEPDFFASELTDEDLAAAALFRELSSPRSCRDTGDVLWYDVLRTLQLAEKDGWGMDPAWHAEHPDATPAEIRMAAVEKDFAYLSGWYNDDWCYVGVVVTLLTEPDEDDESEEVDTVSRWRFESTDTEGQNEYVRDAVEDLLRSNT